MKMVINGEDREIREGLTLAQILEQFGLPLQAGIAVAVNDAVVPRKVLKDYRPREGDAIEIIKAVAGG